LFLPLETYSGFTGGMYQTRKYDNGIVSIHSFDFGVALL